MGNRSSEAYSPFPRRLKEARLAKGLSQKNLGIIAGIDEFSASSQMNQYEKGKHTPDFATLKRLSDVLDVPTGYFYCEEDWLAKAIRALHSEKVRKKYLELEKKGLESPLIEKKINREFKLNFHNTSQFTFSNLLDDPNALARNLNNYIAGFSSEARYILQKFKFEEEIEKLDEANRLFELVKKFKAVDLHPSRIPNMAMGYIFEDLVRRFNEQANEEAGDHFTPREDKFHYMLANPPFGVEWKPEKNEVTKEHNDHGFSGRFGPGLPRINDGALLFLLHMMSKMQPTPERDGTGSRIAIVFNGSPLFTGDAGSGESNIRRWIIENDYLETVVALPDQLFYNTGIFTYVWIVTNRKAAERKGKVQLINATDYFVKMKKSLGDKRNEIGDGTEGKPNHIAQITQM